MIKLNRSKTRFIFTSVRRVKLFKNSSAKNGQGDFVLVVTLKIPMEIFSIENLSSLTSMHSNRMRTAHLLNVSQHVLHSVGVSACPWGGGGSVQVVPACPEVCLPPPPGNGMTDRQV